MRQLIAVFACLIFVTGAHAQTLPGKLSLNFDRVPVIQLLQATYRNMLNLNYVIDPQLAGDARVVTLSVRDLPKEQLKSTVDAVLRESGVGVKDVGGIAYFLPSSRQQGVMPVGTQDGGSSDLIGSLPVGNPTQGNPMVTTSEIGNVGAVSGQQASIPDYEEVKFYEPCCRVSDQLQQIANRMLGTQFAVSDKVILAGTSDRVERVRKLLTQYDDVPPEMLAKALVFEFSDTSSNGNSMQLAFTALLGKLSVGMGGAVKATDTFIRFKDQTIDAVLSAVNGDTRFKLVSAPSVRVRDGAKGRLMVGQDVPVLADAQLDKNGNPLQSVQYRPSGVIFDILPRIMKTRIELNLSQQLSNFQETVTSKINSPTMTKREVSTTVGLESGDMIILGGLDENKDTESRQGLSFLPRLFDTTRTDSSKTQVVIVMQVFRI